MRKRIYYHDTDAGGVVYYGNYLRFLEEARTEYLEAKGMSLDIFRRQEFLYAVRKCDLTYKSPARYGDVIVCDASILKVTAAQIVFEQTVREETTGRLLVTAMVTVVSLNKDFKPVAIPEYIRKLLM